MTADQRTLFLCDEMLHRLGRWLRSAGYDTRIAAGGEADAALLVLARTEGRVLVTRDRPLLDRREAAGRALLVSSNRVPDQIRELARQISLDWLTHAFTRCTVCNTLLRPATPAERLVAPPTVRVRKLTIRCCPGCARLYWPGSHERRMRRALEDVAALD